LNDLKSSLYNPFFSHIYIESEAMEHPNTKDILSRFPASVLVEIKHYKDVFCRGHQDYRLQKNSPSLILAVKHNHLVYEGAPVCQSFGNKNFYYTSSVMNCIYDCEYCYLQGMYPSANMVVFVNLEDIFLEVEALLKKHPVYLCISYDTDLLAMEHILGFAEKWFAFVARHPDLVIELRTKSAGFSALEKLQPLENVILAWTLSPRDVIRSYEHRTPSLDQRLICVRKTMEKGYPVRLCFDPIIYCGNWKYAYEGLIDTVFSAIPADQVLDTGIGVFRMPGDYLKQIRKQRMNSAPVQYPFENDNGIYHYSEKLTKEMVAFVHTLLRQRISEDKIFVWEAVNSIPAVD
jgi:spore photoproduct lyase